VTLTHDLEALDRLISIEPLRQIIGEESLRSFLGIVMNESQDVFERMQEPISTDNTEELWRLAHKLKGILGSAGADQLVQTTNTLQEAARRSDHAELLRTHTLIGSQLAELARLIENYLKSAAQPR
jgi:HPt (histidine-containing phosphotransfer) domain-containing protein